MRADSDYQLHFVNSNWMLRASGAKLINMVCNSCLSRTMKHEPRPDLSVDSMDRILLTKLLLPTCQKNIKESCYASSLVCPKPVICSLSFAPSLSQICCAGPGGPEKPNDQAEKPQVPKKKSQSLLSLWLISFYCVRNAFFGSPLSIMLVYRPFRPPFSSSLFSAAGRIWVRGGSK